MVVSGAGGSDGAAGGAAGDEAPRQQHGGEDGYQHALRARADAHLVPALQPAEAPKRRRRDWWIWTGAAGAVGAGLGGKKRMSFALCEAFKDI